MASFFRFLQATVQLLQLNSTNEICQLNSGTSVMNNSGNHISTPFILNWSQLQSGSSFFILNSPVSQNSKTSSAQISQTEPVTFVAYGRTDCGNGGTNLEDKKCVARNNLSSSINPNTTSGKHFLHLKKTLLNSLSLYSFSCQFCGHV